MKYLLLVYHELAVWANLDPEERDALEQACLAGEQELNARGHLSAVQDVSTSGPPVVVRAGAGAPAVAEGSCAAPGLALAQLCLIDARDFNEAIRLAAWLPHARRGPIEVCALPEPEP